MSTIKAANIQNPSAASAAIVLDTSGNFSVPAGTVSAPGIQAPSDSNTGIFFPAADTIAFAEGGSEAMRIDSSSRLLVGTSSSTSNAKLHVVGTYSQPTISLQDYYGAGTLGSGDLLSAIEFGAIAAGTPASSLNAAKIEAVADGTWSSSSDTPSRLVFSTTADGASSPTERMRITNDGYLRLAGNGLQFNGDTAAANALDDYEEGTFTPTFINSSGSTVAPSGGSVGGAYTKIGRICHIRIHTYAVSNLTNIRRIEGLPFTISGTTDYGGGGIVAGQHGPSGAQSNLSIPNLSFVKDSAPDGLQFNSTYSFPTSGVNIDFCFIYQTV